MGRPIPWRRIATATGIAAAFAAVVGVGALAIVTGLSPTPSVPVAPRDALLIETARPQIGEPRIPPPAPSPPPRVAARPDPPPVPPQPDAVPDRPDEPPVRAPAEPPRKVRARAEPGAVAALPAPTASGAQAPPPRIAHTPVLRPRPDPRLAGVLTPEEIRRLRNALRLTPDQMPHWPPVEALLQEIGAQQMALVKAGQKAEDAFGTGLSMRIYWAARPLLGVLREDQKAKIRAQAKAMGLDSVASSI